MQRTPYKISSPEELQPCKADTEEQEISISANRNDKSLSIFVSDNTWLNKIKKKWSENPDGWECYGVKDKKGQFVGYIFEASKKALSIRSGKRNDSDLAILEAKRERMKKLRAKKNA